MADCNGCCWRYADQRSFFDTRLGDGEIDSARLPVSEVAFDEAGNTGANLLDETQPVFVLASVFVTDEIAALAESDRELKFSKLRKSRAGRTAIMELLNHDALRPDRLVLSGMHKPFMVVTKIVDLLYEPLAHADGIDLYERGANIALSNLLFGALPVFVGQQAFRKILERFVAMIQRPSDLTLNLFYDAVESAYSVSPHEESRDLIAVLLATRPVAEAYLGDFHSGDLDPAIPSFFLHASEWTGRIGGPFSIVHDASKPIENEQLVLEAMMSVTEPPQKVGYDRRQAHFPLSATGIRFGDSQNEPVLQVADVIASSAAYVLRASITGKPDAFCQEMLSSQVLRGTWAPVWPTSEVTPAGLDTEAPAPAVDPHDLVGGYIRQRLGMIPPAGSRRKPKDGNE